MTAGNEALAVKPSPDTSRISIRQPIRAIAGNTGWLMLDRVVRMLIGVTVGAWVARHLGPEKFGALAYVIALLAFFQTATALGMDMILAREVPKRPADAPILLGSALRLRLAVGSIGWSGACIAMAFLRPGDTVALVMTALAAGSLLLQPADLVDLWFQSQSQSRRAAIPRIVSFLTVSGLRVVLILLDAPLWTFAAAYLVDAALATLFIRAAYRRHPTASTWRWDRGTAWALLQHSWPMLLSGISIVAYMRIDQLLLRSLAGDRELGLYSAILPFSQAWNFIPTTVCASAMPFLVRLNADNPNAFRQRLLHLFGLLTWCSFGLCAVVSLGSAPLVHGLLGTRFESASNILSVHVFSNVPIFLGVAQMAYLTIVGRTRLILFQTLAGVVASVALNLILIPRFGALGSAIAGVAAQSVSAVLCNSFLAPELFRMQMTAWFTIVRRR